MNELSDETLMAYVDGELLPEQEDEIRRLLANDHNAQATVLAMQASRDVLQKAFAPILNEPVQQHLIDRIRASAKSEENAAAPGRRARIIDFPSKRTLAWAAALALIIGGLATYSGSQFFYRGGVAPPPTAFVDPVLNEALENTPSGMVFTVANGETNAQREFMPRLSFRDHDDRYCREYEERLIDGSEHQIKYGLACRENDHWQSVSAATHLSTGPQEKSSNAEKYMPAMGQEEDSNIDTLIDELIQGTPIAPEEEAQLISNGWKKTI